MRMSLEGSASPQLHTGHWTRQRVSVSSWFFPHPVIWMLGAAMMVLEVIWAYKAGFTVTTGSMWPVIALGVFATLCGIFQAGERDRLAVIAFTLGFFILFGKQARIFNYLSAAAGFDLVDDSLSHMDEIIGFNWLAHLAWINAHPLVMKLLQFCYDALKPLTALTLVVLMAWGKHERLREFLLLFAVTIIVTLLLSTPFPAEGAFSHYQPPQEYLTNIPERSGRYHLAHLMALRDGTKTLISLDNVAGLVVFPSFHTIMAVLLIWAVRHTYLLLLSVPVCTGMIIATPVHGGHYLIDTLAGFVIAVICIAIYNKICPKARSVK